MIIYVNPTDQTVSYGTEYKNVYNHQDNMFHIRKVNATYRTHNIKKVWVFNH